MTARTPFHPELLTAHAPRPSATAAWLAQLGPFIAVAVIAYPVLVWPLLEAQVVSLEPVYGQPAVDGPPSALLRIYFSILFVLSLMSLAGRALTRPIEVEAPLLVVLAAYIVWAGITSLWAIEPDISQRRFLLTIFIATSIVGGSIAAGDPQRILRMGFWMFAVMCAIALLRVLTSPPTALGHAAFYPHKNYFAAVTSVMLLFAMHQVHSGTRLTRAVGIVMMLLGGWYLIEARSKACLALIVIVPPLAYGTAFLAKYFRISPAISLTALCVTLYGIYEFGAASGFWDFHAFAAAVFGDPTLTQRTDIWNFALSKIAQRPWLGYGFEVFWGASVESPSVREGPGFVAQMPHAHNGYIDVMLQTGGIGLILLMVLLLTTLHAAGRLAQRHFGLGVFCLGTAIFAALYNTLETTWFRSFSLKWIIFALAISFLAQRYEARR